MKRDLLRWLLAVTSTLACIGCDQGDKSNVPQPSPVTCDSSNIVMSCLRLADNICESMADPHDANYRTQFEEDCRGVFTAGPCPSAGRVGGCVNGNGITLIAYYWTPTLPYTAADAKDTCLEYDAGAVFCP